MENKPANPVNPHRAFRQLQRMLHVDDQGRSYRQPPVVRSEDCEVIGTIIYDLANPDPEKQERFERAEKKEGSDGTTVPDVA